MKASSPSGGSRLKIFAGNENVHGEHVTYGKLQAIYNVKDTCMRACLASYNYFTAGTQPIHACYVDVLFQLLSAIR
jgi:hypothetical protein